MYIVYNFEAVSYLHRLFYSCYRSYDC